MSETPTTRDSRPKLISIINLALLFLLVVLVILLINAPPDQGRIHRRATPHPLNNLKNLIASTHEYAARRDERLPSSVFVASEGSPEFGWVVPLLPYLDYESFYNQIDFSKPWDDPANRETTSFYLRLFDNRRIDSLSQEEKRGLLFFAANRRIFLSDGHLTHDQITDGHANTIFHGEITNHFAPWAAPGSLRDTAAGIGNGVDQFGSPGDGILIISYGDGSANTISTDIDPEIFRALGTPDGGEEIEIP